MAKTVLIVEDSSSTRGLAKFAIKKAGYTPLEAEDGVQGLEQLKNNQVDLIITDLNMPNMDGLELVRQVKANPATSSIPIFVCTTEMRPELMATGKELGVMAWIVKPFIPDKLLAALKKVLAE
jgi:two-component system chemotaxis response regulator CheY